MQFTGGADHVEGATGHDRRGGGTIGHRDRAGQAAVLGVEEPQITVVAGHHDAPAGQDRAVVGKDGAALARGGVEQVRQVHRPDGAAVAVVEAHQLVAVGDHENAVAGGLHGAQGPFARGPEAIAGLEADPERLDFWIEWSLALVTPLATEIGYDAAAKLAYQAYREKRQIREVVRESGLLPEEKIAELLDPKRMV